MCTHDQEYGDPRTMSELVDAVVALRWAVTEETLQRAAGAARAARSDGNPWARSLSRGLALVVDLHRAGDVAAARELLDGELLRSLPAQLTPGAAVPADSVLV
jgi:hypothetical protein